MVESADEEKSRQREAPASGLERMSAAGSRKQAQKPKLFLQLRREGVRRRGKLKVMCCCFTLAC